MNRLREVLRRFDYVLLIFTDSNVVVRAKVIVMLSFATRFGNV